MEGNDAIVKCSLPSFAADFLQVISWSSDDAVFVKKSHFYGKFYFVQIKIDGSVIATLNANINLFCEN